MDFKGIDEVYKNLDFINKIKELYYEKDLKKIIEYFFEDAEILNKIILIGKTYLSVEYYCYSDINLESVLSSIRFIKGEKCIPSSYYTSAIIDFLFENKHEKLDEYIINFLSLCYEREEISYDLKKYINDNYKKFFLKVKDFTVFGEYLFTDEDLKQINGNDYFLSTYKNKKMYDLKEIYPKLNINVKLEKEWSGDNFYLGTPYFNMIYSYTDLDLFCFQTLCLNYSALKTLRIYAKYRNPKKVLGELYESLQDNIIPNK